MRSSDWSSDVCSSDLRSSPRAKGLRFLAPLLAHRVASVSRFAAPRPGVFSAAGRCTVVHSPFDTDAPKADRVASRTDAIKELGIAAETPILGYFGNMEIGRAECGGSVCQSV